MRWVQRLVLLILLARAMGSTQAANTSARLVLSHDSARPGEMVWAGLHLRMAPKWHTYWENGGDSGAATRIDWTLPTGLTAGDILWPVPEKNQSAGLTTYVYSNEVLLLVPISIAANAPAGNLELKARAAWLECAEICVPGNAQVSAKLTIGPEEKASADAALIEFWKTKLTQPNPASFARAWWEKAPGGETRPLLIEWTPGQAVKGADFYPLTSTNGTVKTTTELVRVSADLVRLRKEVEKGENGWPQEIAGLLIERGKADALLAAYHVKLSPESSGPGGGSPSAGMATGPSASGVEKKPLLAWLGLAFLGGLILNLMPCVLPVIALKILGFVNQAREAPARVRKLGLIYGLGVLFSFLVLAGVVIGVQSAGKLASWGMQFGNPYFLIGMVALVTLVALNLFGLVEVTLSGRALGTAAELASREGAAGAFFNGVLATALATPCTAPFLASALGFAFAQPAAVIVLMFVAVGLGLGTPYVVLSFQPAWLKFIPKPGAWMEKFKISMGFPMLATALWLLSIVSRHYGSAGVLWVGIFLVFVALAAWIWGEFVQRGSRRQGLAMALSALFLGGGYLLTLA